MKIVLITIVLMTTLLGFDWPSDYKEALQKAKKENKDVYMLITSESCGWCRKFERTTLEDKEVLKLLKERYVLVSMMKEWEYIPKKFKTKRVPRHYFLRADGEVIYTLLGYWNAQDFSSFILEIDKEKKRLGL